MSIAQYFKPAFLERPSPDNTVYKHTFNFRKIWKMTVLITAAVALIPLISITAIDYNVTQKAIESEILLRVGRVASNTKRSIDFFLAKHKSVLDFLINDNTFEELKEVGRLTEILKHLKTGFGGFVDIGVINSKGIQTAYIGDYKLEGKDYSTQPWFKKAVEQGVYISDVFLGFRNQPHFVIAIKRIYSIDADRKSSMAKYSVSTPILEQKTEKDFYLLRATIDAEHFNELLSGLELSGMGDAFIINHSGIIQTPSRIHGDVLKKIDIPIPEYSDHTEVREYMDSRKNTNIVGYAYIPDTNFILMIVKNKVQLMKSWYSTRSILIIFLALSITIILGVILSMTTYLVSNLYIADKKRAMAMHRIGYDNKMATIGRLAAGVAHEINNPLAVINEKAGLIKDMFIYQHKYDKDEKLINLVESVISSVQRCGNITHRLLNFARHLEVSIKSVNIKNLIDDVLGFLGKEAEYRSIKVIVDIPDSLPDMVCDRGKMQQIFLNLINNAFAAIESDGTLKIEAHQKNSQFCIITVSDTGCGIRPADLELIFEPFYTTKASKGGTGLGLSITYGLVSEAGGYINVESEVGKGTRFIVTLPYKHHTGKKEKKIANGL
ncbi:MAG: two-component sensor histidine kinase [Desulfamplus sp.]|nr:two-component sensor histidine kinase [Desulfamplus sp.]